MEAKALHCSREFQAPGGTQQMFIRGGPAQRCNPLPFYIFFFHEKSSPFVDLLLTNGTPFTYLAAKFASLNCCKCTVF